MKWAVGTGRCGMENWKRWQKASIESDVQLRALAVERYHNPETPMNYAVEKFEERASKETPGWADCCQFMFMDIINDIDKDPLFVWIVGDKLSVVEGFMRKNAEAERIHPKGWNFAYENKRPLLEWYYDEVNRIIDKNIKDHNLNYELIHTTDMPRYVE